MENKKKYTIVIYENGKETNRADCRSLVLGYIDAVESCGTFFIGKQNDCVYTSALLDARIKQVLLDEE